MKAITYEPFGNEYVVEPKDRQTMEVDYPERKPLLYDAGGKPLGRRPAGFDTGAEK